MSGLEGGGKIGKELYNALMNANNTKYLNFTNKDT